MVDVFESASELSRRVEAAMHLPEMTDCKLEL